MRQLLLLRRGIDAAIVLIFMTTLLRRLFSPSVYNLDMSSPATLSLAQAAQQRRSIRALQATSPVPDSTITELAQEAIRIVPSAFNSQTVRLTVLFGAEHQKLWSITGDALRAKIGDDRWKAGTKDRIANFAGSYGTILFWDDDEAVAALKKSSPDLYQDKVEEWAHQSNGMHQYFLWTALESFGLGANVQHYNPLIDESVKKAWDLPNAWNLRAQMVFGTPKEGSHPGDRVQKTPVESRVAAFGANSSHVQL